MKNKKHLIVLSVIILLCLCLCLSACGKNKKTEGVEDGTAITPEQTDDQTKDTKPGNNNTEKETEQEQGQPKVVQDENGSGVEAIESSDQSGQTAQNPSSGEATEEKQTENAEPIGEPKEPGKPSEGEVIPQQGVEPIGEPKEPGKPSEGEEPAPAKPLSPAAQEYADYCAMSAEEQYAFYKKFESADAFMEWYNAAKTAYEKENPATVLEPGAAIDLGGN